MVHLTVVGTGDLAHGLSHLFKIHNTLTGKFGNSLEVTKPHFEGGGTFHNTGVPLARFDDALRRADIVVLAIPSSALKNFVSIYGPQLQRKILVDPTNSSSPREDLNTALAGDNETHWVKAFNDIGAVDILMHHAYAKKKIASKMCSPYPEALETLMAFAEASLNFNVKIVPFEKYREIAAHQNSLGEEWMLATWTMLLVFILCQIYNILRHPIAKGYPWYSFPLFCMNKAICWAAITGFALGQVPGILARMDASMYRDTLRDKPKWLLTFLGMRKYLGLISFWFLIVHIFMSCLMFGPNYYGRFFVDPKDPLSRMTVNGELSFMFGSFGAALYCVLAVCSLPSVAEQMTNNQWKLVYGPVAWFAIIFGTVHVICQGAGVTWDKKGRWPWGLPPITLMSTVFPMFVIVLKMFQIAFSRIMYCCTKKNVYD